MSESRKIALSFEPLVAEIVLDRPEKLNALDPEMLGQLGEALAEIEKNSAIRVVVLRANGDRAFCVGADIYAWSALSSLQMWSDWIPRGHQIFDRIASLRQPVICAVHGPALGGGLELALTADIRLAAHDASFGMPEVKLGTVPGWGGTKRLPELVGAESSFSTVEWGLEKAIARRAAMELVRDDAVNLGFGISALVPRILLEEGLHNEVTWVIEQGAVGGMPLIGVVRYLDRGARPGLGLIRLQHRA